MGWLPPDDCHPDRCLLRLWSGACMEGGAAAHWEPACPAPHWLLLQLFTGKAGQDPRPLLLWCLLRGT